MSQTIHCDRCGEITEDGQMAIRVEYKDRGNCIGKQYAYKDLCEPCKHLFIDMLYDFIPGFMQEPYHNKKERTK